MTYLAASIFGDSIEEVRQRFKTATDLGADMIELRLDLMEGIDDDNIRSLVQNKPADVPVIITIRSKAEGGDWDGPDADRIDRLIAFGAVGDYVDVEWAVWKNTASLRRELASLRSRDGNTPDEDREGPATGGGCPPSLIFSHHDMTSRPPTLQAGIVAMLANPGCEVPKLAWRSRSIRDNFEAFELMRQSPRPVIAVCMGEEGLASRVLARKFGAFATFAAVTPGTETAPGQVSLDQMKDLYRWDAIDEQTRVFGVIGDPVRHSLSPFVHNAAFETTGENAVYLPMPVSPSYEAFKAFMVEVLARPWLDVGGFSVTLPHKVNALRYLREAGGQADPRAGRVGAVNTFVVSPDGSLEGHNTDADAAIAAILSGFDRPKTHLEGLPVAVLGAGGAARAIVAGLTDAGAKVTIFNRTEPTAQKLATEFGCEWQPWEARIQADVGLLVNCTSLGLHPNVEASPLPADGMREGIAVFDTVYNPPQTRLLRDAGGRRCLTIDGLAMFAHQAQAQFRLWTGHNLPVSTFQQAARSALAASEPV